MAADSKVAILQFGEGNFLRAFMEDMLQHANDDARYEGSVAIVKPRTGGSLEAFARQNNQYTLLLQGKQDGELVKRTKRITCVNEVYYGDRDYEKYLALSESEDLKLIVSNTTEAGIRFDSSDLNFAEAPATYPGKLTAFLYRRFQTFAKTGTAEHGCVILPFELNENNGELLRECVLRYADHWSLPEAFRTWIISDNLFCNTLVDRIVSGYSEAEMEHQKTKTGFEDRLLVVAEPYGSLIIETEQVDRVLDAFPFGRCGLKVTFTNDMAPYRQQKVKLLNGIHTAICMTGLMMGLEFVSDCMEEPLMRHYIHQLIEAEISPTIRLPQETVQTFAESMVERFENPFLNHSLRSIALNSVSKWETRIYPTIEDYYSMKEEYPKGLLFSLAALNVFYDGGWKECGLDRLQDDADASEILMRHPKLEAPVTEMTDRIKRYGVHSTLEKLVKTSM